MATLSPEQIAIVKATSPVLQEHGNTITAVFYKNLLAAHPELNNVFNRTSQVTGRQPRALAASVLAYATYIDNLEKLQHAVQRIAHKHVSLQVTPAQYDIVGKFLIEAIGQVLKDAATAEIVDAWTNAYAALASVFIGVESNMYASNKAENWEGWRKFRVVRKVPESESITSLYLAPSDGVVPLPNYLPGQYVSLQLYVPQLGCFQSRQYSLSEAPKKSGDYYRISVKREDGGDIAEKQETKGETELIRTSWTVKEQLAKFLRCWSSRHRGPPAQQPPRDTPRPAAGLISNMLHSEIEVGDEVELSHPQGEFFVDPRDKSKDGAPAVLVSAGVGATPLIAILGGLAPSNAGAEFERPLVRRPVSWIHASRSSRSLPFGEAVRAICRDNEDVSARVFLSSAAAADEEKPGRSYGLSQKRLELGGLDRDRDLFIADPRAEYFVCGPEAFMVEVRKTLVEMGVDKGRVHLELFATGDVPD